MIRSKRRRVGCIKVGDIAKRHRWLQNVGHLRTTVAGDAIAYTMSPIIPLRIVKKNYIRLPRHYGGE